MKEIMAWAVVNDTGDICKDGFDRNHMDFPCIRYQKERAIDCCDESVGERVVRVKIIVEPDKAREE